MSAPTSRHRFQVENNVVAYSNDLLVEPYVPPEAFAVKLGAGPESRITDERPSSSDLTAILENGIGITKALRIVVICCVPGIPVQAAVKLSLPMQCLESRVYWRFNDGRNPKNLLAFLLSLRWSLASYPTPS